MKVVVHRYHVFAEYGGFFENLTSLTDWDLVLRYTRHKDPACAPFCGADYFLDSQKLKNIGFMIPYEESRAKIYAWNREERKAMGFEDD